MSSCRSPEENELITAVHYSNDLQKVRDLLSAGCSANVCETDMYAAPVLHSARSAEIAKTLLLYGASVNGTNSFREPPLHTAITVGGGYEVVKVLLKHGADVNYTNRKRDTALTLAVNKSNCCPRTVRELLKYGADISIENRREYSALDYAMRYLDRFKLLVKYCLLYHFKKYSNNKIDLAPYRDRSDYEELVQYYEACVDEIAKMRADNVCGDVSLYNLVTSDECVMTLYPDNELTNKDFSDTYPIYQFNIADKVAECLKRGDLLKTVRESAIFTVFSSSAEGIGKKIILDCDAITAVAKYLTNDDISNLITAFEDSGEVINQGNGSSTSCAENQHIFNRSGTGKDEGSESSSKRAKLDQGLSERESSVL